ncbi:hypothetical protein PIB30_008819 [Stylosanthes scabra]|uniref:Uncharacterized protein n=1 Tax=Stylosanthes scabra TaxID=79078 RepID=A0ABU6X4R5_9FABA|nr:hypothetical protein [Stylosanthes scabra]
MQLKKKNGLEVQRRGKKKLGLDQKKPNSIHNNPKSSSFGLMGWVRKNSFSSMPMSSRQEGKVRKPVPPQATTTPAPLHPHKRRRPPSLQNSPTESALANGDGVRATVASSVQPSTTAASVLEPNSAAAVILSAVGVGSAEQGKVRVIFQSADGGRVFEHGGTSGSHSVSQ